MPQSACAKIHNVLAMSMSYSRRHKLNALLIKPVLHVHVIFPKQPPALKFSILQSQMLTLLD